MLRQDLERHIAYEARVAGAVDLSHAAAADRANHFAVSEPEARRECRNGIHFFAQRTHNRTRKRASRVEKSIVALCLGEDGLERGRQRGSAGGAAHERRALSAIRVGRCAPKR